MHATDIVGYTYDAENFHGNCLISVMVLNRELSPAALDMRNEDVLDQHAGALAIDRMDESSFDSSDFPKVIFASQVEEPEDCAHCGMDLLD